MLTCKCVYDTLRRVGVGLFTGVPDSLFGGLCWYFVDHCEPGRHIVAANEGNAVALATGHYLATDEVGLVYLQNSGLGNALNPLLSLADADVYGIPLLLMIGWRGEPGTPDEPQHVKQGRITVELLNVAEIPVDTLAPSVEEAQRQITSAASRARAENRPVGLLVRPGTIGEHDSVRPTDPSSLTREAALEALLPRLDPTAVVVSTTGKTSRELFEYRAAHGGLRADFLTVGSMGHASQIALGIALASPHRSVWCIDGDGAMVMHMGGLATIAACRPANFTHVVISNGCHESVGSQPISGTEMDLPSLARAAGYAASHRVSTATELHAMLASLAETQGPTLLEVRTRPGARSDLGRPTTTPVENKAELMARLRP